MTRLPRFTFALLAALLLLSITPVMARAAIAVEVTPVTKSGSSVAGATLFHSFSSANDTNGLIVVAVGSVGTTTNYVTVSGVQFNGSAFTLAHQYEANATPAGYSDLEYWYLHPAPNTGANIVVTFNSSGAAASYGIFGAYELSGTNIPVSSSPFGATNDANLQGNAGTITTSFTSTVATSWVLVNAIDMAASGTNITLDGSLTSRWSTNADSGLFVNAFGDKATTTIGTYGATNTDAGTGFIIGLQSQLEVIPFVPTPTPTWTPTATPTWTPTATPTFTPTATPTPTPTATPTPTPNWTPTPTPTLVPVPAASSPYQWNWNTPFVSPLKQISTGQGS